MVSSMSPIGPSRHFAATRYFGRFRSEADIEPGFTSKPSSLSRRRGRLRSTSIVGRPVPPTSPALPARPQAGPMAWVRVSACLPRQRGDCPALYFSVLTMLGSAKVLR